VINVGRGEEHAIAIQTKFASRKHIRIQKAGKDFVLNDLNSRNGTLLNGNKVSTALLSEGDIIRIGDVSFQFYKQETASKVSVQAQKPVELLSDGRVNIRDMLSFGAAEEIQVAAASAGAFLLASEIFRSLTRIDDVESLAERAVDMMIWRFPYVQRACLLARKGPESPLNTAKAKLVEGAAEPIVLLKELVDSVVNEGRSYMLKSVEDELDAYAYTGFPVFDVRSLIAAPVGCSEPYFGILYADSGSSDYYFLLEDLYWLRFLGFACGFIIGRLTGAEPLGTFLEHFSNGEHQRY